MEIFLLIVVGIVVAILASALRVLREYERGVVFCSAGSTTSRVPA